MKRLFLGILFIFNLSFGGTLEEIEKVIHSSKSIKGEFTQISKIEGFDEESKFKGKLYISKPDKVKIEYTFPEKNIIFVEDDKVIIYNPKDKQAAVSNLSDQFIVVKIFNIIAKNENFEKLFDVKEKKKNKKGIIVLLVPKENKDLKSVKIVFSNNGYKIKEIEIIDKENNKIDLVFKSFEYLKKHIPIEFKLPEDVQLFYQ